MSTESHPSRAITLLDLPVPTGITAKFTYNYFVLDERITFARISKYRNKRLLPRYITVKWSKVVISDEKSTSRSIKTNVSSKQRDTQSAGNNVLLNTRNIKTDQDVSVSGYASMHFQQHNVIKELGDFASWMLEAASESTSDLSQIDAAKVLNDITTDAVTAESLAAVMASNDVNDVYIVLSDNTTVKKQGTHYLFEGVEEEKHSVQINNKYIATALKSSQSSAFSPFRKMIFRYDDYIDTLQKQSRDKIKNSVLSESDFTLNVDPTAIETIPHSLDKSTLQTEVIGYIIAKKIDNTVEKIVIQGDTTTTFLDDDVVYNKPYVYSVSAVVKMSFPTLDVRNGQTVNAIIAVESQPSSEVHVLATESSITPTPWAG